MNLEQYYKDYYTKNNYKLENWKMHSRYGFLEKFLLSDKHNATVLDIGCGDASLSKVSEDLEYFGIDINVDVAVTKRAKQWDITQFPYPFEDKFFDLIVCSEVLEHMIDPISILREANRVLKDDGRILISTPNINWLDYKLYPDILSVAFRIDIAHTWEHIRQYDKESFLQMFKESGFEPLLDTFKGADAQYSIFFQSARKAMLKDIFDEEIDIENGTYVQTENLQIVDMMLGRYFPNDMHTIMMEAKKAMVDSEILGDKSVA